MLEVFLAVTAFYSLETAAVASRSLPQWFCVKVNHSRGFQVKTLPSITDKARQNRLQVLPR